MLHPGYGSFPEYVNFGYSILLQHSGHTLKPLDDEYQRRVGQINEQVTLLRSRLGQFVCSLHAIELNMDKIRKAKDEKVREIRSALDMMSARLDAEMKSKLITLICKWFLDGNGGIFISSKTRSIDGNRNDRWHAR